MMCPHCPGNVPLSDPALITSKGRILTSTNIVQDIYIYSKMCPECGTQYRYQEWRDGLHNFNDRIVFDLQLCLDIRHMLQQAIFHNPRWISLERLTWIPFGIHCQWKGSPVDLYQVTKIILLKWSHLFTFGPLGLGRIRHPKPAEEREITVSEDRLKEELYKQKVPVIRALCKECGLDSTGSRTDLLVRLSDEIKSRESYDKVFQKIWAASGGWAVIMCPCGIVYSIKCNIRAESPRDFSDMLLSWKHIPNIVIYDFARGMDPGRLPFKPFEGRLSETTAENIALAKAGKLKVSLPWLNVKKQVPDCNAHPAAGSAEHYELYDRFHEDNTKDPRDELRKQLAGKVNSQVAELLFAKMKKNNYFLNMALPSTHLFLMRNIIHHHNAHKNKQRLDQFTKVFGNGVAMNSYGQAVVETSTTVEPVPMDTDAPAVESLPLTSGPSVPLTSGPSVPLTSGLSVPLTSGPSVPLTSGPSVPLTSGPSVPLTSGPSVPQTIILGYLAQIKPWENGWNPVQDQLLKYVLDRKRPMAEIIVKEGAICLTREDFCSLGLQRDMDSLIGNVCLKLIQEAAQQLGNDIYVENMYVVPTWKGPQESGYINVNFPDDVDMKDFLVFPAWSNANGPDHFLLCTNCSAN